jgi:glucosamine-6-phosphate deaminase
MLNLAGATVQVFARPDDAHRAAAEEVARAIQRAHQARGRAAIGLATGTTPVPVYERLVAMHRDGEVSFTGVSTFNLDEYYPISPADPRSYRTYMDQHLFRHVDLAPNRTHLLDGTVPEAFAAEHAALFDGMIAAEGGLDFQLLGLGRNGHIGFNEPTQLPVDEALKLPTRLVVLHPVTLADASGEFGGAANVPLRALTLGVAPILAARSILVLAFGERKAEALARALDGPMTAEHPASLLQSVADRVTWMVDEAAAEGLG